MTMSNTRWIGAEGAAFARVGLAFQALGFSAPQPDSSDGTGAYASNIINQYRADLSPSEVEAIINYGLRHARATLAMWVKDVGTRDGLRLSDVL
jgi:hypothetical protein